jgi:hypothetical protein
MHSTILRGVRGPVVCCESTAVAVAVCNEEVTIRLLVDKKTYCERKSGEVLFAKV